MLVARDQENLVAHHHNGAALKQQQANRPAGSRYPKTPVKIPLNDENASHVLGGAKSILGGGNRTKGNENVMGTSKGLKGVDRSNFVTPCEPRARPALGNKTTNAKAKGPQAANVKTVIHDIEKSQVKAPGTIRPKQKQPQSDTQKLQVHAEVEDNLSDEEPEYCPPKPKDLPYESDVFPDGGLTFEALKPENLFKGHYQYYYNPVDNEGRSKADKDLEERNRKALEEGERKIMEAMEDVDFSVGDVPETKDYFKKKQAAPVPATSKAKPDGQALAVRRPLSSLASKNAARALSMDDTTKSMQRKASRPIPAVAPKKATNSFIPSLRTARHPLMTTRPTVTKKTSMEIRHIEANSRTTIGYNKGRATASALAQQTTRPLTKKPPVPQFKPKAAGFARTETTTSNDSDRTITPSRFARSKEALAAAEDLEWKERVPFLSIFSPEDEDELDGVGGGLPGALEDDDEFEMQLPE
ncbi:Eukaryotic translation initiation factor 3 subunit J [Apiospora arundinis]